MEITLRRWMTSDANRITELANNEKIACNLRDIFPFPYACRDAVNYLESCLSASDDKNRHRAVCLDGEVVGAVSALRMPDVERICAEIGYWLGEPYWGMGIMPEAVRALCTEVFAETDILRIEADVFSWNNASMRVLEKAGFTKEAVLRRCIIKNGTVGDLHIFSLLK